MRALQLREIEQVSGGFEVSIDLPGIDVLLEEEDFSNSLAAALLSAPQFATKRIVYDDPALKDKDIWEKANPKTGFWLGPLTGEDSGSGDDDI